MGFLAGFTKGIGDEAKQYNQNYMDMQLKKYQSASKIWEAMANDQNYHPAIRQKFAQYAMQLGGVNLFDKNSRAAADEITKQNPHDVATQAHDAQQMTQSAPQAPTQSPDHQSGGFSPQFISQMPQSLYGPEGYKDSMAVNQAEMATKEREAYGQANAQQQAMLHFQAMMGGQGIGGRPADLWRRQQQMMGNKEADHYQAGSWKDSAGIDHKHEMVTWIAGKPFDASGKEIAVPISSASPHYLYDQSGNLIDVGTLQGPQGVQKPSITRQTTKDLWGGGSTTVTSYGGGKRGKASGGTPPISATTSPTPTTPPASPATWKIDAEPPMGTTTTPRAADVPPDMAADPRYQHGIQCLTNRQCSLADFPAPVRPYLAAGMPSEVRAAENSADLQKLVGADKAISLIQSRIQEVRQAAAPDKAGKSILDSGTNRMAIAAILNPPPHPDHPGLYAAGSAFIENAAHQLVRGSIDPKVVDYVTKLRQLRDDILALRSFLGNAPMRSNAQMAIQLAQVPDATISSYQDLDKVLTAFQITPTTAQTIQAGGKPSFPGTHTAVPRTYKFYAKNPKTGQRIGSDDNVNWTDIVTGNPVN